MTDIPTSAPTRLLRAALSAAARGFVVFPVAPRSKTPAVKDWENKATRDPDVIDGWFRSRPYNVGVATGPSKIVVLDLDHSRGQPAPPPWTGATDGRDVLSRLTADAGQPVPADTFTVSTPSGGEHLYFQAPDGVALRNTAAALGWRIDTRAHGVVAAVGVSSRVCVLIEALSAAMRRARSSTLCVSSPDAVDAAGAGFGGLRR